MSGSRSRRKGANGEIELRDLIRSFGFTCERGGSKAARDLLHNIPGVHIEGKRAERINMPAHIRQAKADAKDGEVPTVFYRRSREEWRADVPASWLLELLARQERFRGLLIADTRKLDHHEEAAA